MKNFIGGLFRDQKGAELALTALKENGFESQDESINLLERTENTAIVVRNPSMQSIAIAAVIGGILLGMVGALVGFLSGLGVIPIPAMGIPGSTDLPIEVTPQWVASSALSGLVLGGVTGVILGVAARFWMNKYRKVDSGRHNQNGDFMLAVQTNDMRRETKAKLTMKEYGAIKFEEFREKWDTDVWSAFEEKRQMPQSR